MNNEKVAVVIESPFKGDIKVDARYLEACIRDSCYRGETPYASHKMLTIALDDNDPAERELGIQCGLAMGKRLDKHVFYADLGWSNGMTKALECCKAENRQYEIRRLPREALNEMAKKIKERHKDDNLFW